MSFKRSVIGVAVAVFAFAGMATSARAVVVDAQFAVPGGVLENGETANFSADVFGNNPFFHHWSFTLEGPPGDPLASNSILDVILRNENDAAANNITGLRLELFADNLGLLLGTVQPVGNGIAPIVGPVGNGPGAPTSTAMIPLLGSSLAPGNYFFQITGTGLGTGGEGGTGPTGFYSVQVTATPLPAAIWLMLSALLGLVSLSRIRRGAREEAA